MFSFRCFFSSLAVEEDYRGEDQEDSAAGKKRQGLGKGQDAEVNPYPVSRRTKIPMLPQKQPASRISSGPD